ncbi:hypothetical protein JR316_0013424 [Psilocybe cubensis]|uniref:Uncharacterized protein n=2 Tax=Psilocybe cubensis TaxID=181762 RepID=A0ACB8GF58_PSICU|nr:uncharacterized protein JR316_0013424 [Psilocybe cubensis]KAH9474261.1 hypothetical protein JR316_0013424 [Psilocybe cubensis]
MQVPSPSLYSSFLFLFVSLRYEIEFEFQVLSFELLPVGEEWAYLGQVAWKRGGTTPDHKGLILLAKDGSDALGDIVDWIPTSTFSFSASTSSPSTSITSTSPSPVFSTWRGDPSNPHKYVCGGDFLVLRCTKPTPAQKVGIKAIRRDLVLEVRPDRGVWAREGVVWGVAVEGGVDTENFGVRGQMLSVCNADRVDLLHKRTGAFAVVVGRSGSGSGAGSAVGASARVVVVRFDA